MLPPALDTQLDLLGLVRCHLDRDPVGAATILANCDTRSVANLGARLLAAWMSADDLDELRAAVLRG